MTATNPFAYRKSLLQRLCDWKVRGVRWIEIIGVALVAVMAVPALADGGLPCAR